MELKGRTDVIIRNEQAAAAGKRWGIELFDTARRGRVPGGATQRSDAVAVRHREGQEVEVPPDLPASASTTTVSSVHRVGPELSLHKRVSAEKMALEHGSSRSLTTRSGAGPGPAITAGQREMVELQPVRKRVGGRPRGSSFVRHPVLLNRAPTLCHRPGIQAFEPVRSKARRSHPPSRLHGTFTPPTSTANRWRSHSALSRGGADFERRRWAEI